MFQCNQCGLCCKFENGKNYFGIWEWEVDYIKKQAAQIGCDLDIRPERGYISGNRMVALEYNWYMHGHCPFLTPSLKCGINERKPLMCAQYPYIDDFPPSQCTWRCRREELEKTGKKRKMHYSNPLTRLPKVLGYSALIWRTFLTGNDRFNIDFDSDEYEMILLDQSPPFPEKLFIKPFFAELTRRGIISPTFLKVMNSIKWSNIESYYEMLNQIPSTYIYVPKIIDEIFSEWTGSKDHGQLYVAPPTILPDKGWIRLEILNPPHLFPIDKKIINCLESSPRDGTTEIKIFELLGKRSIRDQLVILNGLHRLAENGIAELNNEGKFKWRLIK